jgi:hypothetical protein
MQVDALLSYLQSVANSCRYILPFNFFSFAGASATENARLRQTIAAEVLANEELRRQVSELQNTVAELQAKDKSTPQSPSTFSVNVVQASRVKGLFQFYTGFTFTTFLLILNTLVPSENVLPFKYTRHVPCFDKMPLPEQLFLVLCKLCSAFHFKDLAFRFGLSPQNASILFTSWINYMYFTFASVSIWPHRDVIMSKMPSKFKQDFPNTFFYY